jgi:hypothetical protein
MRTEQDEPVSTTQMLALWLAGVKTLLIYAAWPTAPGGAFSQVVPLCKLYLRYIKGRAWRCLDGVAVTRYSAQ